VFPARYELNSYIVFRKRLVSKGLSIVSQNEKRFLFASKIQGHAICMPEQQQTILPSVCVFPLFLPNNIIDENDTCTCSF
jgi:hypothetical protein